MKIIPTAIPDALIIEPQVFGDQRGFFMETWSRKKFQEAGLNFDFVQDNHSSSVKGTLRGLHVFCNINFPNFAKSHCEERVREFQFFISAPFRRLLGPSKITRCP